MRSGKKFTIKCVNQIKLEKGEEFSDSIFCDVYEKAIGLVSKIIDDNKIDVDNKYSVLDKSFYNGERFNNVVSFVGKRGMGKSSAMLSLAGYLINYADDSRKVSGDDKFKLKCEGREPYFLALPRIDVAMLTKGENLLDIILANMWTTFYSESEKQVDFDCLVDENKKNFAKVKKSYKKYIDSVNGTGNDTMSSLSDLKELSKCINLMNDFRNLVDIYLRYMKERKNIIDRESFLLIILDDLDVATHNTYDVLDQIRMFLMIPKVVVLVSMDMGRLIFECNKFFENKIWCADDSLKNEQVTKYSQRYLSKVFPDNMRIYMPNLNSEEIVPIEPLLNNMKDLGGGEQTKIKHILYEFIKEYTNICMYPFGRTNYVIRKSSLRDIVNNLNFLYGLRSKSEGKVDALKWIESNLEELKNGTTDHKCHRYMQELMEIDDEYLGSVMIDVALNLLKDYKKNDFNAEPRLGNEKDEYSYLLKCICDLREVDESCAAEMTDFMSLLYSKHIARIQWLDKDEDKKDEDKKDEDKKDKDEKDSFVEFFGRYVFYNVTKYNYKGNIVLEDPMYTKKDEKKASQDYNCEVGKEYFSIDNVRENSSEVEWFEDNADEIYKVVCRTVLSNINIWDYESWEYNRYTWMEGDNQKSVVLSSKENPNFSLDSFIYNVVNYEKLLRGVCINLLACYNGEEVTDSFADSKKIVIDNIMKNQKFHLDKYKELRKNHHIVSMLNVLPLSSVEWMCEIAKEIRRFNSESTSSSTALNKLKKQYNMLISQLDKVEKFYNIKNEEKYTAFLNDIVKELDIFSIAYIEAPEDEGDN